MGVRVRLLVATHPTRSAIALKGQRLWLGLSQGDAVLAGAIALPIFSCPEIAKIRGQN
jgi:hypothetical protein